MWTANRSALESALEEGQPIYGVTTGLGALVTREVAVDETGDAQAALLRSHASGTGPDLPREVVRAAMAVRVERSATRPVWDPIRRARADRRAPER